jgi:hypothetical protein
MGRIHVHGSLHAMRRRGWDQFIQAIGEIWGPLT